LSNNSTYGGLHNSKYSGYNHKNKHNSKYSGYNHGQGGSRHNSGSSSARNVRCKSDSQCKQFGRYKCKKGTFSSHGKCQPECSSDNNCRKQGYKKCSKGFFKKTGVCANLILSEDLELSQESQVNEDDGYSRFLMMLAFVFGIGLGVAALYKKAGNPYAKIDEAVYQNETSALVRAQECEM